MTKKNIKAINHKISPGGYRSKFSFFKNKIMKYDNKSSESKLIEEKYGRLIGDKYDPVKFLNNHAVRTNNLPILNL